MPLERAKALDSADPLRRFRDEFVIDDPNLIYLDGNSLGRLPKRAASMVRQVVDEQWGRDLIRAWPTEWFDLPHRLGAKLAKVLGAHEDEVLLCDSTSVNLYKLLIAALQLQIGRTQILTDDANFPSDWYVMQGVCDLTGHQIEGLEALSDNTAVVTLSHVTFKSGFLYDMAAINEMSHRHGALTIWDLSHSVGAVPIDLNGSGADLAVGCCYKYLNGGPGASAFLYVRRELQERLRNPIQGWFGRNNAFDFGLEYMPRPGIDRFLTGSPNILSMAPIEAGIDLVLEAGIENLRAKSLRQTDFLIELWREYLQPLRFSLNTPDPHAERGSHVSLGHPDALAIDLALIHEMNVIPDFRTPDNIRFGCTPLYTTFEELALAVLRIKEVVDGGLHLKYRDRTPVVT
ncbi:MAG TPA: kynureninase [Fimbriimonas sp.]|nr:kynureninase [Fimbriimonas sp.]